MANISAIILGILVAAIAGIAGYIYVFGIPANIKRELEEKALEKMGENKASFMVKEAVGKLPEGESKDLNELKKNAGNVLGGGLQNPLGKFAGNLGDDATKDVTGR